MTAVKSMDMESILYDLNSLDGEPQNSSSVRGDQMDFGTLSNAFLSDEICERSDLFLFNPPVINTNTNREGLTDLFAGLYSGFPSDKKLHSTPPFTDDYLETYLEMPGFPSLLNCGNLSPLSSEDVESILDTASLSDDGDPSLSSVGSPEVALGCEDIPLVCGDIPRVPEDSPLIPICSPPSLFHHLIPANESDGVQTTDSILDVSSLGHATPGETSRSCSPCLLVSSPGKEKRTKSYRTKKTPYSWDQSTESIPSPIGDDDDDNDLDPPHQGQLSKKEKKKLQNKNAATKYRQKMKDESELRKQEEDDLLEENRQLKNRVEEIQKEIQYLKNLQKEVYKVRTKS